MQCSDERVAKNRQRSDLRRMRSCLGAEQKVNSLEKCDCETLLRKKEMKYIDVEEMRVVANDKTPQNKSKVTLSERECLLNRKVENVVMKGPEVGKSVKEQNLKSIVTNGVMKGKGDMVKSVVKNRVKSGKFGKL